ncbi:GTPase family protein [Kitasatospora sp. NPDC057015]|uniref:GTPase family protein n=1 Tax=Kitasatospora sp. NPDC057015 TaxID=3346001 RepID=UPI00362AE242
MGPPAEPSDPEPAEPGIRRLFLAVESAGPVPQPLLDAVCVAAGADRVWWQRGPRGQRLGLLPPGVDEPRVIHGFIRELGRAVGRSNLTGEIPGRGPRAVLAIGEGITYLDEQGFDGPAVEAAEQLLTVLREAGPGAAGPGGTRPSWADLAVVLTEHLATELLDGPHPRAAPLARLTLAGPLLPGGTPVPIRAEFHGRTAPDTQEGGPTVRVAFLGKTGAGKSSLLNALFGLDLPTGNTSAVTMELHRVRVRLPDPDGGPDLPLEVVDTPGFAESRETEERYRRMFGELLPEVDHVVWVVQSHPRVFRPDQEALIALGDLSARLPLTVALTRADTIGPGDWDTAANQPSPGQRTTLAEQSENVLGKLAPYAPTLRREAVVPCAPTRGYGLDALARCLHAAARAPGPALPSS